MCGDIYSFQDRVKQLLRWGKTAFTGTTELETVGACLLSCLSLLQGFHVCLNHHWHLDFFRCLCLRLTFCFYIIISRYGRRCTHDYLALDGFHRGLLLHSPEIYYFLLLLRLWLSNELFSRLRCLGRKLENFLLG